MFSIVWQKKENEEEGKLERKFSLLSPQFSSSQIGRKMLERKVLSQHFYTNTSFWNQERERERERERESCTFAGTFLNEEEKENKRTGIEIGTTCVEEKKKKKIKEKHMDEMKAEKGDII